MTKEKTEDKNMKRKVYILLAIFVVIVVITLVLGDKFTVANVFRDNGEPIDGIDSSDGWGYYDTYASGALDLEVNQAQEKYGERVTSDKKPILNDEGQVIAIFNPDTEQTQPLEGCLADSGTILFYLDTCPHCHTQLSLFAYPEMLNKIECSKYPTACRGVDAVPTWRFPQGSHTGVLSLNQLAQASGCYP